MNTPLQITFLGMETSPALEERIRKKAEKLGTFFNGITGCRVVVESSTRHLHGNLYHVHVHVSVPGNELVVSREPDQRQDHEDVYIAVRDAFDAMKRQLNDYAEKLRRERVV